MHDERDEADWVEIDSPQGVVEAGLAGGGDLRWVATDIGAPMEYVRRRLDLSPVASAALGRGLAAAAMLLRLTSKTPVRVVVEARGDGPLGSMMAEADEAGNLRGVVGDPRVDVPHYSDSKLAVGTALGSQGFLRVTKEFPGGGRYQSQVELVSGEIGQDVAHYLSQSEQSRSAVLVGVLTRPEGVAAAGGLVVEVLPGAADEVVERLEANVARTQGVSRLLEHGGLPAVKEILLAGLDLEIRESRQVRYHCRCSRERLLRHLVVLSAEDLEGLQEEDRTIRAECAFCGESYAFQPGELDPSGSVS